MALCGVFYYVDSEKVLVSVDDCQKRKLHVGLRRLVVNTRPRRFRIVIFLIYVCHSIRFMQLLRIFIECLL
jgi:hypothetical protein